MKDETAPVDATGDIADARTVGHEVFLWNVVDGPDVNRPAGVSQVGRRTTLTGSPRPGRFRDLECAAASNPRAGRPSGSSLGRGANELAVGCGAEVGHAGYPLSLETG